MIDFSTLQGLTIPEGVVTQVTDAQGRVLWSAVKEPVTGTLYLRPTSSVYIGDGVYWQPETTPISDICSLINEEVSDGASTYIAVSSSVDNADRNVRFKISGKLPKQILKINDIRLVMSMKKDADGEYDDQTYAPTSWAGVDPIRLYAGSTTFVTNTTRTGTNFLSAARDYADPVSVSLLSKHLLSTGYNTESLNALNDYVAAHGTIPEIELELEFFANGDNKGTAAYLNVSQIYIELDCEYIE